jgi:anion-transporting  ArsA/GET3 family ATPase
MSKRATYHPIDEIIKKRRIIITCGTGGVGKTTLSSALALRAALLGRKAVVITIDPAKRLATSLGIHSLGNDPTDLTPQVRGAWEKAKANGKNVPDTITGSLVAIVPDTRKTFETFVKELAPDPQVAQRVMDNPIFQIFAKEFSGTNEYMALERLYELNQKGEFDCIILDTPPSRNTLDFLDAPQLLAQLFESGLIRYLVKPANAVLAAGMKKAFSILERLTGAGFIQHLYDFGASLFEVRVNFTKNLKNITELLQSKAVGFLMVTVPAPDTAPEALHFIEKVETHGFRFDGIVLNRTLDYFEKPLESNTQAMRVVKAIQDREKKVIEALAQKPIQLSAKLPELARDVHSVEDLFHVALALEKEFKF